MLARRDGDASRQFATPSDGEAMSEATIMSASRDIVPVRALGRTGAWVAIVGLGFIIVAIGAGGYELASLAMSGRYSAITLGEIWYALDVGSLNLVQAVIQRFLHPALWDPLIVWLLRWPVWSLVGGTGVLLTTVHLARNR